MKLSRLWAHHQQSSFPKSLADNFGDAYLLTHNRIYRNLRQAVLTKGFKFSPAPDAFYQALPLSQLESLLAKKTIPYIDNSSVLKKLHTQLPENILWDDISDNLKGNHVFHESCHGVARSLIQKIYQPQNSIKKSDLQKLTLVRLLEESFANTCELLAVTDVGDPTHRIFFELNSYVCMFEDRTHLKNAMAAFGANFFMKFMLLTYLHANFLTAPLSDPTLDKIVFLIQDQKMAPLTASQRKTLRALAKIAYELNLRFRMVTTRFYLHLIGVNIPMPELLDFDFLRMLQDSPELLLVIDELADVALNEPLSFS